MAYNEFTLEKIKQEFQLSLNEETSLFAATPEIPLGPHLSTTLAQNIPLALAINTEKARSEMIIAPILIEVRNILERQISLFSGVEFNVDRQLGLNGVCDFILSRSKEQLFVSVPVVTIVEAKNENIKGGLAQCIAAMMAAKIFNERAEAPLPTIYGAVTAGNLWKFLRLERDLVSIDLDEYYANQAAKVVGILVGMAKG
jgi:hypothetical protein